METGDKIAKLMRLFKADASSEKCHHLFYLTVYRGGFWSRPYAMKRWTLNTAVDLLNDMGTPYRYTNGVMVYESTAKPSPETSATV